MGQHPGRRRPHPPGRRRHGRGADLPPADHRFGGQDGQDGPGRRVARHGQVQSLRFLPVLGQLRRPGRRPLPPHLHPPAARRDRAPRSPQGQPDQRGEEDPGLRGDQDHPRRARGGEGPDGRGRGVLEGRSGRIRKSGRQRRPAAHDGRAALAPRGGHLAGRPVHRGRPDALPQGGQEDDRAGRALRQRRACRLRRAPRLGQGPGPRRRHRPQGRQEESPPHRPRLIVR
ncbi:MAG: hypothetical protein MZV64_63965 [Ignavibacteriales bacterium]|nr:hypothetical protein [Ignavibacteriales bacterium]